MCFHQLTQVLSGTKQGRNAGTQVGCYLPSADCELRALRGGWEAVTGVGSEGGCRDPLGQGHTGS